MRSPLHLPARCPVRPGAEHRQRTARRQRGAGLVQMMVALTIGAVISTGLLEILVSNKRTYRAHEAQARVQETGRFGIELLTHEIRMAGYMGCPNLDRVTPRTVANPAPATSFDNTNVFQGYEAGDTSWTPALPAALASATAGRDAITVHRGGDCAVPLAAAMAQDTSTLQLTSGHGCGFTAGDYLLVSDCVNTDLFRASNVSSASGVETIGHATTHNTSDRFSKAYGTGAVVMRLQETSYFIAPGAGGLPALWMQQDDDPALELVEGVENLQILYGEDLDNDRSADRYVTPDTAGFDVSRVVGVRLNLLLQTVFDNVTLAPQTYTYAGSTGTAADRRLRRVFVTTVNLRNRTTL